MVYISPKMFKWLRKHGYIPKPSPKELKDIANRNAKLIELLTQPKESEDE